MNIHSSGLSDHDDLFGDADPQVRVELDRDEHAPPSPEEADGRPLDASASPTFANGEDPFATPLERSSGNDPYPQSPDAPPGVTQPSRRGSSSRFLTDVIVDMGLASRERVDAAIEASRNEGTTPERVLLGSGGITADGLARALAERYGLDHLDLDIFSVDMGAANLVVNTAAKRYQAVPVAFVDKRTLLLAMADPSNVLAVDDVAIMTGYEVRVAVASPDAIGELISRMARLDDVVSGDGAVEEAEDSQAEIVNLRETADDAPVVKLVNQIVAQAVERGASDVHLAPDGHEVRVRVRVDGILQDITTVPRRMAAGVVSRVKIMAELDISERRLPQDGRVSLTVDGRHVDLRVVTLPSVHGESIVMRILDKDSVVMKLEKLGMADAERERFEHAFHETHGAVLVTGPTGSGKSTTLYAALLALNTPEKNIITVEDPVEYQLEGITQVQVSTKVGLTFAAGLRAMVRADPDVIMVGEIRDRGGHEERLDPHLDKAGDGRRRVVPRGLRGRLRARSATRSYVVLQLQAAHDRPSRGPARERLQGAGGPRGLRVHGLPPLLRHRLPRSSGDL
jgi:type IV pilus assembly protein PilB